MFDARVVLLFFCVVRLGVGRWCVYFRCCVVGAVFRYAVFAFLCCLFAIFLFGGVWCVLGVVLCSVC